MYLLRPRVYVMIFKIFFWKKSKENRRFLLNLSRKKDHIIGFQAKKPFFRRKLAEIAKKRDHTIWILPI
jgi:hypothetical protein